MVTNMWMKHYFTSKMWILSRKKLHKPALCPFKAWHRINPLSYDSSWLVINKVTVLFEQDSHLSINFPEWLGMLVGEIYTKIQKKGDIPLTIYHIICGLMRHLRESSNPTVDLLKEDVFVNFWKNWAETKKEQTRPDYTRWGRKSKDFGWTFSNLTVKQYMYMYMLYMIVWITSE